MRRHRLRREIVATRVTNDLIDRAGTTFVFRLREDTGASPADIARASIVARDVFERALAVGGDRGARRQRRGRDQYEMLLSSRRMVERATRWLLRSRPRPLDIAAEVARYADGARTVAGALPGVLVESEQEAWRERVGAAHRGGRAGGARRRAWRRRARCSRALDIVEVAGATEHPVEEVAALHFLLGGSAAPALAARPDRAAPARQPLAAMARAALRDDLFSLHAELTADVLRYGGIDAWMEANRPRSSAPRRSSARSARAARSTSRRCRSRCARCAT